MPLSLHTIKLIKNLTSRIVSHHFPDIPHAKTIGGLAGLGAGTYVAHKLDTSRTAQKLGFATRDLRGTTFGQRSRLRKFGKENQITDMLGWRRTGLRGTYPRYPKGLTLYGVNRQGKRISQDI